MPKITNRTTPPRDFGLNESEDNITVYGSLEEGTVKKTTDLKEIEGSSRYLDGLRGGSIIKGNQASVPSLESLGSLFVANNVRITETYYRSNYPYDASINYMTNHTCLYDNNIWLSITDNNKGNTPAEEGMNWYLLSYNLSVHINLAVNSLLANFGAFVGRAQRKLNVFDKNLPIYYSQAFIPCIDNGIGHLANDVLTEDDINNNTVRALIQQTPVPLSDISFRVTDNIFFSDFIFSGYANSKLYIKATIFMTYKPIKIDSSAEDITYTLIARDNAGKVLKEQEQFSDGVIADSEYAYKNTANESNKMLLQLDSGYKNNLHSLEIRVTSNKGANSNFKAAIDKGCFCGYLLMEDTEMGKTGRGSYKTTRTSARSGTSVSIGGGIIIND